MKLLPLFLLLSAMAGAQALPEAPAPQPTPAPKFFQLGHWDSPHALRTNSQTLKSPYFLIPLGAAWTAGIIDYRVNRKGSARGELLDDFGPLAACSILAYGSDRLIWRPISVGILSFITFRHVRGAVTRVYP